MSTAVSPSVDQPRVGGDPELLLAALDPEQREVATALHGPVAVIAGAGTGKTRAITHRIAYGVAVGAYQPTAVLAVTFTTRAAGEMRGRLQQLGARGVQARTFHSAALRQAQYFWPKAYGGEFPSVLDNRMSLVAESASRLRVRVDTARLRDLLGEISWAKVSNTTPEDYPRVAAPLGRTVSGTDPETVARIFTGYEDLKRQRGRIDFEDILLCTAALLAEHDEIRVQVQRTYRHLVVDEYQDVSPLQHRLLELWRGDRAELCVVGDPAQTIHSFAGAQADFLTGFGRRHPTATVVRLVRDYRSTPQVVAAANAVMRAGQGGSGGDGAQTRDRTAIDAVTLQAQRPPGPEPVLREAPDEAAEAAVVADWLSGLAARGVDYREMAVLFRINAQSPVVEQALAERGIPYLVRGGERFYERAEVRQALHALRTQARAMTELSGGEGREAVAEVQAVLGALGWTEKPPEGAGAVRERWESLAALVAVAEDLAATSDTPLDLPRCRGRARASGRGPARAVRPGGHCVDPPLGQGPGVGRGCPVRHPGRFAAVRARDPARGGGRGTSTPLRRCDPCPRAPARVVVAEPRWWSGHPASRPGSSIRCCPRRCAGALLPRGSGRGRRAPCCRPTVAAAAMR